MSDAERNLLDKLRHLHVDRVAEVEDFIDFLRARQEDEKLSQAATKAAEPAFARVWDNDEDAVYDRD